MKKTITCDIPIATWHTKAKNIQLPSNQEFTLVVDYPIAFNDPYEFKFKTGKNGMDFVAIVNKIVDIYHKIYANPDKYTVFGHNIYDLYLEGFVVDFNKRRINLYIGS